MKRRLICLLVISVMAAGMTACGTKKNSTSTTKGDKIENSSNNLDKDSENSSNKDSTTDVDNHQVTSDKYENNTDKKTSESDKNGENENDKTGENVKREETISGDNSKGTSQTGFARGIWWSVGSEDGDCYYQFLNDEDGTFLYQDSGMGVGFTYELNGNAAVFHMGDVESNLFVSVEYISDETVKFTLENGDVQILTYQGDRTFEDFQFYSNDELCEMAKKYLKMTTGEEVEYVAAEVSESGLINIQLYDSFDGHNSTASWYFVDRFTGKGTDILEREIDLTEVLEE